MTYIAWDLARPKVLIEENKFQCCQKIKKDLHQRPSQGINYPGRILKAVLKTSFELVKQTFGQIFITKAQIDNYCIFPLANGWCLTCLQVKFNFCQFSSFCIKMRFDLLNESYNAYKVKM